MPTPKNYVIEFVIRTDLDEEEVTELAAEMAAELEENHLKENENLILHRTIPVDRYIGENAGSFDQSMEDWLDKLEQDG